jgi:3-dehydrosphinganine reductase
MFQYNHKVALVTGGSSGIGLAIACRLAQQGANVWILGRTVSRLETALAQVQAARADEAQVCGMLAADVSRPAEIQAALDQVTASVGAPDVLVNSAGVAHPGYFEELDLAIFREMMEINYFGTLYTTHAAIKAMLARGSGLVVNISSIAGFMGVFGYTAYGASKYAVRGFSDVLRAEMKPRGIQVCVAFPPDTETPQLHYEDQFKPFETRDLAGNAKAMSAEAVADVIVREAAKGRYLILPGSEGKMMYTLSGLAGGLLYPLMDRMVASARQKKDKAAHAG